MLRLRPYKKCDAKEIVSWIKDEVSFHKWSANRFDHYPITAEDLNQHYEENSYSDSFFPMTAFDDSGIVGHLFLRFMNDEKTEIRFGYVVVDGEKRGKGYGKAMLKLALQYAFTILNVSKVSLGVFENNPPARYCYQAVGFTANPEENWVVQVGEEDWTCICMGIDYDTYKIHMKKEL